MSTTRSAKGTDRFGAWLAARLRERGLTQNEFAEKLGVSKSTVSRWINGDRPKGIFIDQMADILVLDYDIVATNAGYRPKELLELDPDSPTARLMPLIEKIDWDSRPGRLEEMEAELRFMIAIDQERQRRQG